MTSDSRFGKGATEQALRAGCKAREGGQGGVWKWDRGALAQPFNPRSTFLSEAGHPLRTREAHISPHLLRRSVVVHSFFGPSCPDDDIFLRFGRFPSPTDQEGASGCLTEIHVAPFFLFFPFSLVLVSTRRSLSLRLLARDPSLSLESADCSPPSATIPESSPSTSERIDRPDKPGPNPPRPPPPAASTMPTDMAEDDVERQVQAEKPRAAERSVHAIFYIAYV